MRVFNKIVLVGLISIGSLASAVHADRATLTDNDWDGMTETSIYAGNAAAWTDPYDPHNLLQISAILPLRDGSVIVADTGNQVIKRVIDGEVTVFSGVSLARDAKGLPAGALVDGARDASAYHSPAGLDQDTQGNIYVADAGNHAIRKIDANGSVTTIAGDGVIGLVDGTAEQARFYHPSDVAVAEDGTIYVADTLNHVIRKIDTDGRVTTLNAASERIVEIVPGIVEDAGDYQDGPLSQARFNEPSGLALDARGNLYVSDTGNHRIRYINLASGEVTTVAGGALADASSGELYEEGALYAAGDYRDGTASEALFHAPKGITLTEDGGLLIADSENHVIRYMKNGQVKTIAGVPTRYGSENGIEHQNRLYRPLDVALTEDGKLLIADSYNNAIRQVALYELPSQYVASNIIQVIYGDQVIDFEVNPEVEHSRTMVQARFVAEALGYEVDYIDDEQKITLRKDDRAIEFRLGQTDLIVRHGESVEAEMQMDVAPYAKHNRTYLPVRFFAEVIGMDVSWIQDAQAVIIRDKVIE